jgi:hypothetical protein
LIAEADDADVDPQEVCDALQEEADAIMIDEAMKKA